MTYTVSSGTLNSTMPYYAMLGFPQSSSLGFVLLTLYPSLLSTSEGVSTIYNTSSFVLCSVNDTIILWPVATKLTVEQNENCTTTHRFNSRPQNPKQRVRGCSPSRWKRNLRQWWRSSACWQRHVITSASRFCFYLLMFVCGQDNSKRWHQTLNLE